MYVEWTRDVFNEDQWLGRSMDVLFGVLTFEALAN